MILVKRRRSNKKCKIIMNFVYDFFEDEFVVECELWFWLNVVLMFFGELDSFVLNLFFKLFVLGEVVEE